MRFDVKDPGIPLSELTELIQIPDPLAGFGEVKGAKKGEGKNIQRRTLLAIFCETRRPNKEMQTMIADQLGLKVSTVANFFMNARRRSTEKYCDDDEGGGEPPAAAAASGPLPVNNASDAGVVDWKVHSQMATSAVRVSATQ